MKNFFKLLLALSLLLSVTAFADVKATAVTTSTNTVLLATPYTLTSVTIANTDTNKVLTARFYDIATTNTYYTNAAYTNWISYSTSVVASFVGSTGITNSFTNTVLYQAPVVYGAVTNAISPMATFAVPAGQVATYQLNVPVARGLAVSNDAYGTVILYYRSD